MPLPSRLEPMLAEIVPEPFDSPAHLFEVKWDGLRVLAFIEDGRCILRSRTGRDLTGAFPELAGLARQVRARSAILDGEVVAFSPEGRPSFGLVQPRLGQGRALRDAAALAPVAYQVFDLPWLDDLPLLDEPLATRRTRLAGVLEPGGPVQVTDFVLEHGREYFAVIERLGLEGMVAKAIASPYRPGRRGRHWTKVKVNRSGPFAIAGWTSGEGSRGGAFGSLVLAAWTPGGLVHVGQVGGGFSDRQLREIGTLVRERAMPESPLAEPAEIPRLAGWIRPGPVAQVRYAELTAQRRLRFPVFEGLVDVPLEACLLPAVGGVEH